MGVFKEQKEGTWAVIRWARWAGRRRLGLRGRQESLPRQDFSGYERESGFCSEFREGYQRVLSGESMWSHLNILKTTVVRSLIQPCTGLLGRRETQ